jgi:hypothetical protein
MGSSDKFCEANQEEGGNQSEQTSYLGHLVRLREAS